MDHVLLQIYCNMDHVLLDILQHGPCCKIDITGLLQISLHGSWFIADITIWTLAYYRYDFSALL